MKIIERSNRVPIPRVITLRGTEPILDPPPPLSPFICFHQKRKENGFTPKIGSVLLLVIIHQVTKVKMCFDLFVAKTYVSRIGIRIEIFRLDDDETTR